MRQGNAHTCPKIRYMLCAVSYIFSGNDPYKTSKNALTVPYYPLTLGYYPRILQQDIRKKYDLIRLRAV